MTTPMPQMPPISRRPFRTAAALALVAALSACSTAPQPQSAPDGKAATAAGTRTAVLMSINDVYRIEGLDEGTVAGLARIRALRKELAAQNPELLVFHGGDFLFPSFASRMYSGEQMVALMNDLDGDPNADDERMVVVFGNHEFEKTKMKDAPILAKRIEESQFRWLAGNLTFKPGEDGKPVVDSPKVTRTLMLESGGIRIGVFGLTIPMDSVAYVDFAGPNATAKELTAELRAQGAEVVIALTHLNAVDDRALLETLGDDGPDLILGGHDHEKMAIEVGKRLVLKADADARTATVVKLTLGPDGLNVAHEFRALADDSPRPDPDAQILVGQWQARHEREFCAKTNEPSNCLETLYGSTRTVLEAEENKIRGQETSLGDWVADQMLREAAPCGAQVAFINAGTLRLNQDLAAGTKITRRQIEELFGYETPLRLVRINGAILQQVADQSTRGWPGSGTWLQIAGFAWVHDQQGRRATNLTLLTPQGPRPVRPDEEILAAVGDYLVNPQIGDQDGYSMLKPELIVTDCPATGPEVQDVKKIIVKALQDAQPQGIAPVADGRICQPDDGRPCLADGAAEQRPR